MKLRLTLTPVLWLLFALCCAPLCHAIADYAAPGPFPVESFEAEWSYTPQGTQAERKVPSKVYYPTETTGTLPVIIFSHGLGGSRENYGYLAQHWTSHGFICIHPTHLGSDTGVLRGTLRPMKALRRAAADPENIATRPQDITCVIDQLERLNRDPGALQGRINAQAIGVAGHSFGAFTTLAIGGQSIGFRKATLADPRVRALIPMSAPANKAPAALLSQKYQAIRIPCLHMTGTEDSSPIGDTSPADRRIPFDHMQGTDQYLLTFTGGDHMVFSGRARRNQNPQDEPMQHIIRAASLAFWDAYLRDDPSAKAWLKTGGFESALGLLGKFEAK